eukprot:EG_transcript_16065
MGSSDAPSSSSSYPALLLQLGAQRDTALAELRHALAAEAAAADQEQSAWAVEERLLCQLQARAEEELCHLKWQVEHQEKTLMTLRHWSLLLRGTDDPRPTQSTDPSPSSPPQWSDLSPVLATSPPPSVSPPRKRVRSAALPAGDDATQLSGPMGPPRGRCPVLDEDSLQMLWAAPPSSPDRPFKHREVVRKKAAREGLKGHTCQGCAAFYVGADLPAAGEAVQAASRHRFRRGHTPPATPQGFWDLQFFSSATHPPD